MRENVFCVLERRSVPDEPLCGYVKHVADGLIAIEKFHDFYSEGVSFVRVDDIVRVQRGERERFFDRVIGAESLRGLAEPPHGLGRWRDVLGWAKEHGELVAVASVSAHDDDSGFWVGRVEAVHDLAVTLTEVTPEGKWQDDPSEIALGDVREIEVMTPYLRYFRKYALTGPRELSG